MWAVAAIALLVCMVGPFIRCIRGGDTVGRLVALQAGSSMSVFVLLAICEAYHRFPFVDLALSLALLNFGAGLVFARFLERWL
jgi:multicomponent Na+:H+ antiporter subunit F